MRTRAVTYVFLIFGIVSCKVDPKVVPALPADHLSQEVPEGWPQPQYNFSANPISQDKFILGRELFYETMLSKDNSISCGSCHQPFVAFAQKDHQFSHGVVDKNGRDQLGTRNSPGLFNLAWSTSFMHDGGINHIEVQPLGPISNPIEMGEDINNVMNKLRGSAKYRGLFTKAYGSDEVTTEKTMKSMAQFMGLLLSAQSKYDRFKKGTSEFTEQEKKGYSLFVSKCSGCHTEPLFTDFKLRSNGLLPDPLIQDSGRAHITRSQQDIYKFKTPSLRNIALTMPYMHDGRYNTLEECLDHYTDNVKNHTNLDPKLEYGIPMTPAEKQDIIAFLNTLTDYEFISDPRFKDPNRP